MGKEHRDRNVKNLANWRFACQKCGHLFKVEGTVADLYAHFQKEHGATDRKVEVELKWVGLGPPPKSRPNIPMLN